MTAPPPAKAAPDVLRLRARVPWRPGLARRIAPEPVEPTTAPAPASAKANTPEPAVSASANTAAPPSPDPARTYTAADFFTALATTPPRAGLARWERWVVGIAILAGLTLAFAWPFIKERRARIAAQHRAEAEARLATPAPSPYPVAAPERSAGFTWPPAALNGGVRAPRPERAWWFL